MSSNSKISRPENVVPTMSNVILREYERERKSTIDTRKTEYELSLLEKRFNDKSKWNSRADKTNLIKEVFRTSEIKNIKLTPSVDQWLEAKKLRNERKAATNPRSYSRNSFQ
jgi:hypothetical protein